MLNELANIYFLPQEHIKFLVDNGYKVSDLKTKGCYWIFNDTHCIVVKVGLFDLFMYPDFENKTELRLLATVCDELSLDNFIVLLSAFGFINI